MRKPARFLPLLLLLVTLTACGATDDDRPAPADDGAATGSVRDLSRSVRTVTAEQGQLTATRRATVSIEAAREATIASGASGRVTEVLIDEGNDAREGDIVLQLDDLQLQLQVDNARVSVESARVNLEKARSAAGEGEGQARAGLRTAELNLEMQQRMYREAEQIFERGGMARSELDGIRTQLAQAEGAVQEARDAVARSERSGGEDLELLRLQLDASETQLRQAEEQLRDAQVKAPFDGVIVSLLAKTGEFIGAGQPAFMLSSSGPKLARFSVPTEDVAGLTELEQLTVVHAGRDYAAELRPTGGIPAQGRMVNLTAELEEDSAGIPGGSVASLPYEIVLAEGALLPAGAVRGGDEVLVEQDGRAESLAVTVLAETGGQVAVSGLPEDARVIYPLPADLRPGTAVRIVD